MVDFTAVETPEQQAFRQEVRDFLDKELDFEFDWDYDEDDAGWDRTRDFWRKAGARGYTAVGWPKEYHGLGRNAYDKWIVNEEFAARHAPDYPGIGMSVADSVMRLGTHEQRLVHLKGIQSADILWGEGFTEPESGSDLASLETRAVRDGDEWVLNGSKTFGTAAHRTQWMFVFARTNMDVPKHAGLSAFLIPIDSPGLTMTPLWNIAGGRQNQTYFDNVRVPLDCQLGDVDRAWQQVWFHMGGDHLDKGGPAPSLRTVKLRRALDLLEAYCKETIRHGKPMIEDSVIRHKLADLEIGVEGVKMLEYESFSQFQSEQPSPFGNFLNACVFKEFEPEFAQTCMEILGPTAQIQGGKYAPLAGLIDHVYRASFGNHAGGTSQLKRMVLATRGLGLPR